MKREKIAIIGIGEVPTGFFPERSCKEIAMQTSLEAIQDAGIDKNEIDTILVTGALSDRMSFEIHMATGRMIEELGLGNRVKTNACIFSGGSSSANTLKIAEGLIRAGRANVILCIHADKLGTCGTPEQVENILRNAVFCPEWEIPYGINGVVLCDWIMNRYIYETGTTLEQIAAVVESNRKWARLNPHAAFRDEISVEEVMKATILTSVSTSAHFQTYTDGGSAFIVTSAERAKEAPKPVYVLGMGSRCINSIITTCPDITRFSYKEAAEEAYEEAGLTPKDMNFAQIFEWYAIMQLIVFEELGFAERGKAGEYFAAGKCAPGGEMPVNTNGGILAQGHTGAGGGYALLIEAVRQLKGQAGERQIPNARYGLYTSSGGSFFDCHVTILGNDSAAL